MPRLLALQELIGGLSHPVKERAFPHTLFVTVTATSVSTPTFFVTKACLVLPYAFILPLIPFTKFLRCSQHMAFAQNAGSVDSIKPSHERPAPIPSTLYI